MVLHFKTLSFYFKALLSGQNGQFVQQLRPVVLERNQEHAIALTMIAREAYLKLKAAIIVDVSYCRIDNF